MHTPATWGFISDRERQNSLAEDPRLPPVRITLPSCRAWQLSFFSLQRGNEAKRGGQVGESAWRRSGMGKDKNLFCGAFVRQPGFCNARAPGLGDEGHPSDAFSASGNEPRSLRKRGKCCILLQEGEQRRGWGEVQVQLLGQSPGTAPVNTTPKMPWWEHSQAAPVTSCYPSSAFEAFKADGSSSGRAGVGPGCALESLGAGMGLRDAHLGELSSPPLPLPWPFAWRS